MQRAADASPIIMAGTAMPAMRPIPTGAPTSVPSCQRIFFFLDHGFFPQKVQPEGLQGETKRQGLSTMPLQGPPRCRGQRAHNTTATLT